MSRGAAWHVSVLRALSPTGLFWELTVSASDIRMVQSSTPKNLLGKNVPLLLTQFATRESVGIALLVELNADLKMDC